MRTSWFLLFGFLHKDRDSRHRGVDTSRRLLRNTQRMFAWLKYLMILWSTFSGGSKGGPEGRAPPPWGPKFFQFHAVFGKIWQNRMLAPPPGELAPPPRGNPGSATDFVGFTEEFNTNIRHKVYYSWSLRTFHGHNDWVTSPFVL